MIKKAALSLGTLAFAFGALFAEQQHPLVGEYGGRIEMKKGEFSNNPEVYFRVHKEGDKYKIDIQHDLWRRADYYSRFDAKEQDGKIEFQNGWRKIKGVITKDEVVGTLWDKIDDQETEIEFKLPRINRPSPTLGAKPPKGAVVLFDGTNFNSWKAINNKPIVWKIDSKEKAMQVAKDAEGRSSDIETKRKFKNFKLHIEFMSPDESYKGGMGQHRGNSGVFLGRFEVQVLDSFGCEGIWNECGALYKFMPPQFNAVLPPENWQTYDITFYGAKDKNGKLDKFPRITVVHNGMVIHKDVEITEGTEHQSKNRSLANLHEGEFPIKLQFHGDPVKYRNIWLEEIPPQDDEAELIKKPSRKR